ncbi:MAG TPA: hypothetical protein VJ909_01205 [Prolixibacteraceae bacterium]|nr:hypothetical protein [Prolixibacteraceae bacterium]
MIKQNIKKHAVLMLAALFVTMSLSAQMKIKPKVSNIYGDYKFVMVIKANEKFEKPERVVTQDFSPSEEAFDPNKIDQYPKWEFKHLGVVDNKTGGIIDYVAIINVETGKYYHRDGDMKSEEEFKKDTENKEDGNFKDYWKAMKYYFKPEVKNEEYVWFRIPNKDDKNLVVTPPYWRTREVKLVLAKQ